MTYFFKSNIARNINHKSVMMMIAYTCIMVFTSMTIVSHSYASTIDETQPVTGSALSSSVMRANFAAAKSDIEALEASSTNWDTAYGWGDHSIMGYITNASETDPTALKTADTDNVKDSHLDFGSGAGQIDLDDLSSGTNNKFSAQSCTYVVCATDAVNPKNCDYTADGTADDVQIQAAIDAIEPANGLVCLSDGAFTLAATVTLTTVSLKGMSQNSTIISGAFNDVYFDNLGNKTVISDMYILPTGTPTVGQVGIQLGTALTYTQGTVVERVTFENNYIGLLWGSASSSRVDNCLFKLNLKYGIQIDNDYNSDQGDNNIANSHFTDSANVSDAHLYITSGSGLRVANNKFIFSKGAIVANITDANSYQSVLQINNNSIENQTVDHIKIITTDADTTYYRIHIIANELAGFTAGTIGIEIEKATQVLINNNIISGEATLASKGIDLENVDVFTLSDNVFQYWGTAIDIDSGSSLGYIGPQSWANVTTAITNASATVMSLYDEDYNIPVARLNSGTNASDSTFWRGDGTWATPAGGHTQNTDVKIIAGNTDITVTDAGDGYIAGTEDGSEIFRWTSGRLGINTATPLAQIEIKGLAAVAGSDTLSTSGTSTTVTVPSADYAALNLGDTIVAGSPASTRVVVAKPGTPIITVNAPVNWNTPATYTYQRPAFIRTDESGVIKTLLAGNGRIHLGGISNGTQIDHKLAIMHDGTGSIATTNTSTSGSGAGSGILAFSDDGAALAAGDRLGFFLFGGATDNAHTLANSTGLGAFAADNWTGSSSPSYLRFDTTPSGTTTRAERARIYSDGGMALRSKTNSYTANTTLSLLEVSGTILNNYNNGDDSDVQLTGPDVDLYPGANFIMNYITTMTGTNYFAFKANANQVIYNGNTAGSAGGCLRNTSQTIGDKLTCFADKTGASTADWFCATIGTWDTTCP